MKEVVLKGRKYCLVSGEEFYNFTSKDVEELFGRRFLLVAWAVRQPSGERWAYQVRIPANILPTYMTAKELTNAWVFLPM